MPPPVVGPCGGDNQPPCPPVSAVMQALSDLLWAYEGENANYTDRADAHAAAHALIDPPRKP